MMTEERDIRFTQKKVDEAWKNAIRQDQAVNKALAQDAAATQSQDTQASPDQQQPSREISFSVLISSLGMQALIQLGLMPQPGTKQTHHDLAGAQETIDMLIMLKEKTEGNCTKEEDALLTHLIADLQVKYVSASQHGSPRS